MGQSGSFFSGLSLLFYERSRPQIETLRYKTQTQSKVQIQPPNFASGSYIKQSVLTARSEATPQRTIDAEHRKTIKIRYICSLGQWNCQERESDGQKALHHPPKIPAS